MLLSLSLDSDSSGCVACAAGAATIGSDSFGVVVKDADPSDSVAS